MNISLNDTIFDIYAKKKLGEPCTCGSTDFRHWYSLKICNKCNSYFEIIWPAKESLEWDK